MSVIIIMMPFFLDYTLWNVKQCWIVFKHSYLTSSVHLNLLQLSKLLHVEWLCDEMCARPCWNDSNNFAVFCCRVKRLTSCYDALHFLDYVRVRSIVIDVYKPRLVILQPFWISANDRVDFIVGVPELLS